MKSTLIFLAAGTAGLCWGQAPPDCNPNPLNVPEAKYPCIFPDNRVMYRVMAPNAQSVRVGNTHLTKGPDNIWSGTTAQPAVEGFCYYGVNRRRNRRGIRPLERTSASDGGTPELRSRRRTRISTSRKTFLAVA